MPEMLWKSYIDFEISQGEWERTRALYRNLLERTKHVKVCACTYAASGICCVRVCWYGQHACMLVLEPNYTTA